MQGTKQNQISMLTFAIPSFKLTEAK